MTARWTSSQRARTGKVTYMNDRGRMIASLVGGNNMFSNGRRGTKS